MSVVDIPVKVTLSASGGYLKVRVQSSVVLVKMEEIGASGERLKLESGRTLFDLVLEAARTFVVEFNVREFTAADLYHVAVEKHPELNLRQNTWASHVVGSAPNHPSYGHHTAHRKYFRYLGRGKYSLDPTIGVSGGGKTNGKS